MYKPIYLVIQVYTNKRMLVEVYLDKDKVFDTPESAESVISETRWRQFEKYKLTNEQQKCYVKAAFPR